MSARVVFLGCALGVFGGCSLFVSTTGLSEESAANTPDVFVPGTGTVEDASFGVTGSAVVDGAVIDADAGVSVSGAVWPANGHRYEIRVYPQPKTWIEARDEAVAAGGHLVTTTSPAEAGFVASLVYARPEAFEGYFGPWIGAYQQEATGPWDGPAEGWAWVTGEPWGFADWRRTEPNDESGNEQRAHYFRISDADRGWNDIGDTTNKVRSAVVEYE